MKKLFILPLLCTVLMVSCSNDGDCIIPEVIDTTTTQEYFQQHRDAITEEFEINSNEDNTLTLESGSKIRIKPGTFSLGGQVYDGKVNVNVIEVRPKALSRSIYSSTNTNYSYWGSEQYLQTYGYLNIEATTKDGAQLEKYLNKNMDITIATDYADGTEAQLWTGVEPEDDDKDDDQFAWGGFMEKDIIWDDTDWANGRFGSTTANAGGFSFSFGKLGWVNVDVVWSPKDKNTTITVIVGGMIGKWASYQGYNGDTYVFFISESWPVVVQIYTQVSGQSNAVQSYAEQMPVGVKGKMLAFSVVDGKYMMAMEEVTTEENQQINLELIETTREKLDETIKSIDGYGDPK